MKKKTGPKPLPKEQRRKRITITLLPRHHKLVAGHSSPGAYVEHCISLARLISNEQFGLLVEQMQKTNQGVDVLVYEAVKRYLSGLSTPNSLSNGNQLRRRTSFVARKES